MKFNRSNLNVLAYANGFTLWHYASQAPLSQVMVENYFSPAKDEVHTSDMVIATCHDGSTLLLVINDDGVVRTVQPVEGGGNGREH